MSVVLAPVSLAEKTELRAVFNPYLIEHADLVDPARVHGDPTDQPYFDLYWTEPERIPLWILADGVRAGFVLLNAWSPSGLGVDRAIAEFYVARPSAAPASARRPRSPPWPWLRAGGSCRSSTPTPTPWPSGPASWPRPRSRTTRRSKARTGWSTASARPRLAPFLSRGTRERGTAGRAQAKSRRWRGKASSSADRRPLAGLSG